MTAPAVMLVVLTIMAAGPPPSPDITPSATLAEPTTSAQASLASALAPDGQAAHVVREPPAGSGPEFVRYASPPELHDGLLAGGLFAWTGVLIGGLMFLEKRRLASLVIGGGGLAVGLALMLTG